MIVRRVVPLAGTLVCVWLVVRHVELGAVRDALSGLPLLAGLLAGLIALTEEALVGPFKWRRVVAAVGPNLSFREALLVRLGSQPIRSLAPLKSGEAASVLYLNRVHGVELDVAASTSLFEKAVNLWATIALMLAGLALQLTGAVSHLALAAIGLWVWLPFLRGPWRALVVVLDRRFGRPGRFAGRLLRAFVALPSAELARQLPLALLFTGLEVLSAWILLWGLGVSAPFGVVLVVVPLSFFLNNIPAFVLGIGIREALFVVAMAPLADSAVLFSLGICVSFFEYILPTLVGLLLVRSFLARLTAHGDP